MPTYGGNGDIVVYDGSATHDPTEKDLLQQIAAFFGINGVPETSGMAAGRFMSQFWSQIHYGNVWRYGEKEKSELQKAIMHMVLGGQADPNAWLDILYGIDDWLKSGHQLTSGEMEPYRAPSGGGDTIYGGVEELQSLLTEQPVWYTEPTGGLSAAEIQAAVWALQVPYEDAIYGNASTTNLQDALRLILTGMQKHAASVGYTWPWLPDYVIYPKNITYWWSRSAGLWSFSDNPANYPPPIDNTLWLPTDTLSTYLAREQPSWAWSTVSPVGVDNPDGYLWTWKGTEFLKNFWIRTKGKAGESILPVTPEPATGGETRYPGASGVTFADPITVTETGTFAADCDGTLLSITDIPPGQGRQPAGDVTRFPYVGWLAFVDAEGNEDNLQRIELDKSIFIPHTMSRAAGITVYAKRGLQLVLTPWTIGA